MIANYQQAISIFCCSKKKRLRKIKSFELNSNRQIVVSISRKRDGYLMPIQLLKLNIQIKKNCSIDNQDRHLQSQIGSNLVAQYYDFFTDIEQNKLSMQQLLLKIMHSTSNVMLLEESSQFSVKITRHLHNFVALQLQVRLQYFHFQVFVYSSNEKSHSHKLKDISCTQESSVFMDVEIMQDTVIKCINISQDSFQEGFARVIKEFCLLKVAAILNIGPKLSSIYGFDIVVFKECAEFCTERCSPIIQLNAQTVMTLKQKLWSLHRLKIVHLDIKPENIRFSPSLNEPIFLDFGFSNIVEESIGQRTKTTFVETLGFSSPEMIECYNNRCVSYVDVYYNDVFCLKRSISQLSQNSKKAILKQPYFSSQDISGITKVQFQHTRQMNIIIFYRFLIFTNKRELLKQQQYHLLSRKIKESIIFFCLSLPYSQFVEKCFELMKVNYTIQCLKQNMNPRSLVERYHANNNYKHIRQLTEGSKFSQFLSGVFVERKFLTNDQVTFADKTKIKDIALNQGIITVIKKEIYLEKMATFLDFYRNLSKFHEKVKASQLMISIYKVPRKDHQQSQFSDIKLCLLYLLQFFIGKQNQACVELVPRLLNSLIVVEGITQETVQYMKKIAGMRLPSTRMKIHLLFRCYLVKQQLFSFTFVDKHINKLFIQMQLIELKQFQQLALSQNVQIKQVSLFVFQVMHLSLQKQFPTKKFTITKERIQKMQQYIGPHFKRQLLIYFEMFHLGYIIENGIQDQSMKCIQRLNDLESSQKGQYTRFQTYHFWYWNAMMILGNTFIAFEIYKRLQECLDNKKLLQRYRMYQLHGRAYSVVEILGNFQQLLTQADLSKFTNIMTCMNFIYILNAKCSFTQNSIERDNIKDNFAELRIKFPLSFLRQAKEYFIKDQTFLEPSINKEFIIFVLAMSELHESSEEFIVEIELLMQQLSQNWNQTSCVYCRETSTFIAIFIQAFILKIRNKYHEVAELYRYCLQSNSSFNVNQKLYFIILMIDVCQYIKDYEIQSKYRQTAYEWIKKQNAWSFIISSQNKKAFQNVTIHLLQNKKYQESLAVQLGYLHIIKIYALDCYIHFYILQLSHFLVMRQQTRHHVWSFLSEQLLSQFMQNDFSIIFFSLLLVELGDQRTAKYDKVIRFICRKMDCLHFKARPLIIGHLYYISIRSSEKGRVVHKTRQIRFFFKKLAKCNLLNISFSQYKKHICKQRKLTYYEGFDNRKIYFLIQSLKTHYKSFNLLCNELRCVCHFYPIPFSGRDYEINDRQELVKYLRNHY